MSTTHNFINNGISNQSHPIKELFIRYLKCRRPQINENEILIAKTDIFIKYLNEIVIYSLKIVFIKIIPSKF